MQIVFAHYHLNPGGVTQVILNQLLALSTLPEGERPSRVGVLYGGRREGWPDLVAKSSVPFDVQLLPLPAIDYDDHTTADSSALADEVASLLTENEFSTGDTLLHLHNHALGKNASWTGAAGELSQRGYRLLLQIHDFAEDFRPTNYGLLSRALAEEDSHALAERIYPQAEGIHYATLTHRDGGLLREAGVTDDRRHILPNPVGEFADLKEASEVSQFVRQQLGIPADAQLVLYPVRGIRRKNLGEMLLRAALSPPTTWHAVTLAPQNPVELSSFDRWRGLAKELELRCLFDCCGDHQVKFLDALAGCDVILTTSIAEGFGMVFLEAWMAGKPLVGRDLPEITAEFREAGLQLDGLNRAFNVPIDWLPSREELVESLSLAYQWACDSYGVESATKSEADALRTRFDERSTIDFSLLPSRYQEKVIRRVTADPHAARQQLVADNPGLRCNTATGQPIAENAEIVRKVYSLKTIGRRLRDVYTSLAKCPAACEREPLPYGESILRHFLRLDRLHPIRFEE